jgi:hypothetical protein
MPLVTTQAATTLPRQLHDVMAAAWWIWKTDRPVHRMVPLMSKESLFALRLFPYLGFFGSSGNRVATRPVMVGFYLLLVFVVVTIPAGLYARNVYGRSYQCGLAPWRCGSRFNLISKYCGSGFAQGALQQNTQSK